MSTDPYRPLRELMAETPGAPRSERPWEVNRFVLVWDDAPGEPGVMRGGSVVIRCAGVDSIIPPRLHPDGESLREKTIAALRKRGWREYRLCHGYEFQDPTNQEWPVFLEWLAQRTAPAKEATECATG